MRLVVVILIAGMMWGFLSYITVTQVTPKPHGVLSVFEHKTPSGKSCHILKDGEHIVAFDCD